MSDTFTTSKLKNLVVVISMAGEYFNRAVVMDSLGNIICEDVICEISKNADGKGGDSQCALKFNFASGSLTNSNSPTGMYNTIASESALKLDKSPNRDIDA